MKWTEVREHFPHRWLLVEATEAHSKDNHRILDELAVIGTFPSGERAMDGYIELHGKAPERELYVLHTDREELDIEELRWMGIRGVPCSQMTVEDFEVQIDGIIGMDFLLMTQAIIDLGALEMRSRKA